MKERQSNIELLRIISMFFIVLEHVFIIGSDFFTSPIGNQLVVANSIIGFTYIGVNCFILITGFFGADFSWKRLISLYLICAFYELVGFLIAYVLGEAQWNISTLGNIIFPLSHHESFFIRCYVILLFLLPLINTAITHMNKSQFSYVLLLLTILNLYFGWFHKQPNFNEDGYNASQMVYLYAIGRYLNQYVAWEKIRPYKKYIFGGWIILAFLWGIIQNVHDLIHVVPHWNGWAYNNPIVLSSAIMLFAYFSCLNMEYPRVVNRLGASMLAVFLIHMNRYLVKPIFEAVRDVIYLPPITQSLPLQVLVAVGLALIIVIVLAIIDQPRMRVHKWLLDRLQSLCERVHTHTHTHTLGRR